MISAVAGTKTARRDLPTTSNGGGGALSGSPVNDRSEIWWQQKVLLTFRKVTWRRDWLLDHQ